jgi:hypothetical protein
MTATDAALIALGEQFEKLLLEHMDAWLEWAPRMRAAHAEVRDNMAAKHALEQDTFHDRAQAARAGLAHALFARKVQRKLRNGVAGFAAAGSSLDQRVREGAGCWPPGPSCVSPAPQLKREWSPWPEFGWFPANQRDFSKG